METKQAKTFPECCDEVAAKHGWGMWKNVVMNGNFHLNSDTRQMMREAAELYAKERMKEAYELGRLNPNKSYESFIEGFD